MEKNTAQYWTIISFQRPYLNLVQHKINLCIPHPCSLKIFAPALIY